MLSAVKINAILLSVMLDGILLCAIMLNVISHCVVQLNVILLNVIETLELWLELFTVTKCTGMLLAFNVYSRLACTN